jgi:hypothetical protein
MDEPELKIIDVFICKLRKRRLEDSEPDLEEAASEPVSVDVELAPPLQPDRDDEHEFVTSNFPEFLKRERVED